MFSLVNITRKNISSLEILPYILNRNFLTLGSSIIDAMAIGGQGCFDKVLKPEYVVQTIGGEGPGVTY